jgi:hypothetical protein
VSKGYESADEILAAAPDSIGTIPSSLTGLAHAAPTGDAPFLVEGLRAHANGRQKRAASDISIDGRAVVRLDSGLATAVNLLLFPGVARREFIGSRGLEQETLLVAPTLPLVVAQWDSDADGGPIQVTVLADPMGGNPTPDCVQDGRIIVASLDPVRPDPLDPTWVVVSVAPRPRRIIQGDRSWTFLIDPQPGGAVSVAVSAGTAGEVRAALTAAAHAPGHAIRAARGPEEGLYLETGVEEIDDGIAWARARLRHIRPANDVSRATVGLASAAVGDRSTLDRLRDDIAESSPWAVLLAAQTATSFGDASPASAAADLILREIERGAVPDSTPIMKLSTGRLADALRYAATDSTIATLRSLSATKRSAAPPAPQAEGTSGGRTLPMAGPRPPLVEASMEAREAGWLGSLLDGTPLSTSVAPVASGSDRIRRIAEAFVTNPDEAWVAWRRILTEGLTSGPAGPCSWSNLSSDLRGPGADETAELILALTQGLLGLTPDAPVGRLRLAPRFPRHVTSFTVGGIVLGDSVVRLEYVRNATRLRYTLIPERASVPPLIILEPTLPTGITAARVDGEPADLVQTPVAGLVMVSVQLPLDASRTLELDLASAEDA